MSEQVSKKWYYGLGPVLTALFLFGPFAFPLLWKSPRFNFLWKIILTVVVTLSTVYMIAGTWHVFVIAMNHLKVQGLV